MDDFFINKKITLIKNCNFGLHFIANDNIEKGETLIEEFPIIIIDKDDKNKKLALRNALISQQIKIKLKNLFPRTNEEASLLSSSISEEIYEFVSDLNIDHSEIKMYYDKLCFNGFDFGHTYIYENASHFNHSCCPNMEYTDFGDKFLADTNRDISKGEQLFISYVPVDMIETRERRVELLNKLWNFKCKCRLCCDT